MSDQLDEQIQLLITEVETKRKTLGEAPTEKFRTNGIILGSNIRTLTNPVDLLELTANILQKIHFYERANEILDIGFTEFKDIIQNFRNYLIDINIQYSVVKWKKENNKLATLELQLSSLKSEDAKRKEKLDEIKKLIG